jgi:hypothetical protein
LVDVPTSDKVGKNNRPHDGAQTAFARTFLCSRVLSMI